MAKVIQTLRNNWKKTVFGVGVLSFGVNYARNSYLEEKLMREYCEEAKKYGDQIMPPTELPKRVTVLLNPASNSGKGRDRFEKYCAPLLNLAGFQVNVIQTEAEGQARDLMQVMNNTDVVLIAGGDGTLSEAVTGLLRRDDAQQVAKLWPIGVLPVGKTNQTAKTLFSPFSRDNVKLMAESAIAVIKGSTREVDVMKIQIQDEEEATRKPIYALSSLEWGIFRDENEKRDKFWLWGPLKPYASVFFTAFRTEGKTWECAGNVAYTDPCPGCNKCRETPKAPQQIVKKRWWEAFITRKGLIVPQTPVVDYSKIENPNCGVWKEASLKTFEFNVHTENATGKKTVPESLEVQIFPESISTLGFMKEGFLRIHERPGEPVSKIHAQSVKLIPETKDKESWFSIDQEAFEVKPVQVSLLPNKIIMFCTPGSQ